MESVLNLSLDIIVYSAIIFVHDCMGVLLDSITFVILFTIFALDMRLTYYFCVISQKRMTLGLQIFNDHLAHEASNPINVDAATRREVEEKLHLFERDLFKTCQRKVRIVSF